MNQITAINFEALHYICAFILTACLLLAFSRLQSNSVSILKIRKKIFFNIIKSYIFSTYSLVLGFYKFLLQIVKNHSTFILICFNCILLFSIYFTNNLSAFIENSKIIIFISATAIITFNFLININFLTILKDF